MVQVLEEGARVTSDEMQRREKQRLREKPKKRKKRSKTKTLSIIVPSSLHRKLKKRAKDVGCSVSSLVKNYIHNGLEGVVYTESYRQTRTVSQTVQQEKEFTVKGKKAPANYAAPAYFKELKQVIAARKKKRKGG